MNLLAIETATEACSAALYYNGEQLEKYQFSQQGHSDLILNMIDSLFAEAEMAKSKLDYIVLGKGPGSFTGVRIACGVAQGLAYALNIPVVPISTLAILAQPLASQYDTISVAINARMQEVYWGVYKTNEHATTLACANEIVCPPEHVALPDTVCYGVGSGWDCYTKQLKTRLAHLYSGYQKDSFPHASASLPLALAAIKNKQYCPAEQAIPVYIRNNVAST